MAAAERSGTAGSGGGNNIDDDPSPPSPSPPRRADAAAATATADDGATRSSSRGGRRAVLLYYCYAPLVDDDLQSRLAEWYRVQCRSLHGRVRVAKDGVNATLGGPEGALRSLIGAHSPSPSSAPPPPGLPPERVASIDFKLQLCDDDDDNTASADFCPSKGVRVRLVDELVTFGGAAAAFPRPLEPQRAADGEDKTSFFPTHMSPRQFHAFLEAVKSNGGRDPMTGEPVVLLDARNAYETALGKFSVPGVPTLDPRTRRLADLPGWIDAHERLLARRTILSYCTGGVRCERAAAILRARGEGFERVAQLEGGVQRYLEAAAFGVGPAGGFFEGVNFVFDSRGHVGPSGGGKEDDDHEAAVGRCAACGGKGASYGARRRCAHCRMLLPLCSACAAGAEGGDGVAALPACALCAERQRQQQRPSPSLLPLSSPPPHRRRPLRLLCLHGFRSTAGQLRARLRPLERALHGLAELCFVDAPLGLPLWFRPPSGPAAAAAAPAKPLPPPFPKRAWLASKRVLDAATEAARSGAPPRWEPAPSWLDDEEDDAGDAEEGDGGGEAQRPTSASSIRPRGAAARQDRGWSEAVAAVARAAAEEAPFDGALGFSQGAAVVAGLMALRQRRQQGEGGDPLDPDERAACAAVGRFAVLICGFAPAAPRPLAALERVAAASAARQQGQEPSAPPPSPPSSPPLLQVPSLHVFPAEGGPEAPPRHACVPGEASWALARLFEPSKRAVLRLGGGGGSGGGEAAAAVEPAAGAERAKNGGAQMLPITPVRIARVRQFLLDVISGEEDEEVEE
jgi:predicted sulfurtransferase